jgi:hypothetical protein
MALVLMLDVSLLRQVPGKLSRTASFCPFWVLYLILQNNGVDASFVVYISLASLSSSLEFTNAWGCGRHGAVGRI